MKETKVNDIEKNADNRDAPVIPGVRTGRFVVGEIIKTEKCDKEDIPKKTERSSGIRCGRFIIGKERPYTEEEKREANKDLN
jgi:hypothetical protein